MTRVMRWTDCTRGVHDELQIKPRDAGVYSIRYLLNRLFRAVSAMGADPENYLSKALDAIKAYPVVPRSKAVNAIGP